MGGFKKTTFKALLRYLYTDQCPTNLSQVETIDLIELANFLCLPCLVTLAEKMLVCALRVHILNEKDVTENVAALLEPAKVCKIKKECVWTNQYKVMVLRKGNWPPYQFSIRQYLWMFLLLSLEDNFFLLDVLPFYVKSYYISVRGNFKPNHLLTCSSTRFPTVVIT